MINKIAFLAAILLISVVSTSAAQEATHGSCGAYGMRVYRRLAEVAAAAPVTGYFACKPGGECLSTSIPPESPVLVYREEGEWTCGYYEGPSGAAPIWVRSRDLRTMPVNPTPSLEEWVGTWKQWDDQIVIGLSADPGALHLSGNAYWPGKDSRNVRFGKFEGEAAPKGNQLHFERISDRLCALDISLFGNYIVLEDNLRCGDTNVRFYGIYRRTAQK